MMYPTIVVAAFNRHLSLRRLLESLSQAEYPESVQPVIILSLDGGYTSDVYAECLKFSETFSRGKVEIIARDKNIGLRAHILWCGDQAERSGAVIVLEDDLYVDPQFYLYAMAAAGYYNDVDEVAGIALYSQRYNEYAGLPFQPLEAGYTNYFMQVACSWGQLWTLNQWQSFKSWYANKQSADLEQLDALPDGVKNWPESSWKKYFSGYLADADKTYVYPYRSYSTNCSDPGGHHISVGTNHLHVPLPYPRRKADSFDFMPMDRDSIRYDTFMEPASHFIFELLGQSERDLEIDIYGIKPEKLIKKKRFILTTQPCKDVLAYYSLSFRPFENMFFHRQQTGDVVLCRSCDVRKRGSFSSYSLVSYLSGHDVVTKGKLMLIMRQAFVKLLRKLTRSKH